MSGDRGTDAEKNSGACSIEKDREAKERAQGLAGVFAELSGLSARKAAEELNARLTPEYGYLTQGVARDSFFPLSNGWIASHAGFAGGLRKDAKVAGITNITFLAEDVQTYPFQPVHDFCFSRFGTQFFENPVAGSRNMRRSLKPGGIMTMIVWRGIKDNPWLGSAKDVVLRYLPHRARMRPVLNG
jgi:SAM-dependent methyltransferase